MFAPIDPRGGSPQLTAIADTFGQGGKAPYTFLTPGLGQLARGHVPQASPLGFNPGGVRQPYEPPQGVVQQLIQHIIQQGMGAPHQGLHPSAPGSDIFTGNLPGLPHGGHAQQLPLYQPHHEMVGAAQNLARFLAQQHTAGLRRYNGRF